MPDVRVRNNGRNIPMNALSSAPDRNNTELGQLQASTSELTAAIRDYGDRSGYEDIHHAVLALGIVAHALTEVAEHSGLGGDLPRTPDPDAHQEARTLLDQLSALTDGVRRLHDGHPSDDSEAALIALELTRGSLIEVAERYEP